MDEGQIKIGMSADAVYIAWGRPSEVLQEETSSRVKPAPGDITEAGCRKLAIGPISRNKTPKQYLYLERYLVSDYNPRDYVRAEIVFKDGKVISWRTLPRPTS